MTSRAVLAAEQQAASGRLPQAVALLERAAASRDVDALFSLATWHLAAHGVPRDLARARDLLHKAVAIGHVDAALMEVALTANGSGGPADWGRALGLLRSAANSDPLARDHHALIEAMILDETGDPVSIAEPETLSTAWDVRLFRRFLSPAECKHIATEGQSLLEPALVIDPRTGKRVPNAVRTSDSGVFGPAREDLVVRAINRRIAAASGTSVTCGEPLTLLRYARGQQYRLHHDCLPGARNQRAWTMLIYLNEGYVGGETHFPRLGLSVKGRAGDALLFRNQLDDGKACELAVHQGNPVSAGAKWLCTRWIRAMDHDPWEHRA